MASRNGILHLALVAGLAVLLSGCHAQGARYQYGYHGGYAYGAAYHQGPGHGYHRHGHDTHQRHHRYRHHGW